LQESTIQSRAESNKPTAPTIRRATPFPVVETLLERFSTKTTSARNKGKDQFNPFCGKKRQAGFLNTFLKVFKGFKYRQPSG